RHRDFQKYSGPRCSPPALTMNPRDGEIHQARSQPLPEWRALEISAHGLAEAALPPRGVQLRLEERLEPAPNPVRLNRTPSAAMTGRYPSRMKHSCRSGLQVYSASG